MSSAPPEVPLSGGTLSAVVRVGDTVRRSAGPWTPAVHALLRHIRSQGFVLAPEPLGLDDAGRDTLRFIPGETVGWRLPWPEWVRREDTLRSIGRATAALHRAVADFRPDGPLPWRSGGAPLRAGQIVCHHDLAPYNVVAVGGRLRGIIDWDLAGPGTARSELAFVAWQWVPLHGPFVTSVLGWPVDVDRAQRLRLLLEAYGLADRDGFLADVAERIRHNRAVMMERAAAGDAAYRTLVDQGHVAGMDEALGFVEAEGQGLQARL